MVRRRWGRIVSISSDSACAATAGRQLSAAKAGLIVATKRWRRRSPAATSGQLRGPGLNETD
jgi:NAD(P)-dependent dehydrogenase (short-subunit alcohol dehydrogenase family)